MRTVLYLILSLVSMVAYAALQCAYHYREHEKRKSYEILREAANGAWGAACIFSMWFFLEILNDGLDSPVKWWFLCGFIGLVVCSIIQYLVGLACKKIWPASNDPSVVIEHIHTPKGYKIAKDIILILFCILFSGLISYALVVKGPKAFGTGMTICMVLVALLCIFGAVISVKDILKKIPRTGLGTGGVKSGKNR